MFLSTFEKQLDQKRRLVVPAEFRASESGVYCFPSFEADCIEAGGQALLDKYTAVIETLDFASEERSALEHAVYGAMRSLAFDAAGRITLPEDLCAGFALAPLDQVVVVGLRDRFQIWRADAYRDYSQAQRGKALGGLATARQRLRGVA